MEKSTVPGDLHYYQGGDWAGLTQKLQYIKDLGFTAIWISAPQENEKYSRSGDEAGYHGYYTKDFNRPNSHFGTEAELKALIAAADNLGLKIIIDAQLNHTADYLEYPSTTYSPADYKPAAPFDNPAWYHNTPNIVNFDDPNEAQNYSLGGLDDLAQENPDCWQALMDAYWNPDTDSGWFSYGFAGSRVDAVIEIPPQYLALYEQHTGKPSFGEAFTGSVDANAAFQNYMWGMLDFPLYFQMNKVFCKGEAWGGVKWVLDQDDKYNDTNRLFTFLDNHDRSRFLANAGDNWAKLRLALAFQYAVRGIPVVYYGTEQNMAGDFKYTEDTINYYNREMMSSFSENTTTFQYLRRLNRLRREYSDLFTQGVQRELYYSHGDPVYAFSRRNEKNGNELICLFNNSASEQTRTITLNPGGASFTTRCPAHRPFKYRLGHSSPGGGRSEQPEHHGYAASEPRNDADQRLPGRIPSARLYPDQGHHPLRHRIRQHPFAPRRHPAAPLGLRAEVRKRRRRYVAVHPGAPRLRQPVVQGPPERHDLGIRK